MGEYVIEKGIPMPRARRGRSYKYGFDQLNPGDSVLIPGETTADFQGRIRVAACNAGKRAAGRRFETRVVAGGMRVWRVE